MPYVAHVAVKLQTKYTKYEYDKWDTITLVNAFKIYRRLTSRNLLEIASEPVKDKWIAVGIGKKIYTSILIQILWNGVCFVDAGCDTYANRFYNEEYDCDRQEDMPECQLIWQKNCSGGGIGLDIYEVDSFDELDRKANYLELDISYSSDQDFLSKIDLQRIFFDYTPVTQKYLSVLCDAEHIVDLGLRMALYCGILEKLAGEREKDQKVINEIDKLIEHVKESELDEKQKESLVGLLSSGKKESARGKILELCSKYGKEKYGKFDTKKIIQEAYSMRSIFAHTGPNDQVYSSAAWMIKWVTIDVLCGYFIDHPEKMDE